MKYLTAGPLHPLCKQYFETKTINMFGYIYMYTHTDMFIKTKQKLFCICPAVSKMEHSDYEEAVPSLVEIGPVVLEKKT